VAVNIETGCGSEMTHGNGSNISCVPSMFAMLKCLNNSSSTMAENQTLSDEAIVPAAVRAALQHTETDPRPVVLMTCGIAG
jgi:hypothetical protein